MRYAPRNITGTIRVRCVCVLALAALPESASLMPRRRKVGLLRVGWCMLVGVRPMVELAPG